MKKITLSLLVVSTLIFTVACSTEDKAKDNTETQQETKEFIKNVYEITEENVSIDSGDHKIPATITLPVGAKTTVPGVVMLHGTASSRNEVGDQFKNLANELAQKGIASVRIDFAGTGDSDRDYALYTVSGAVADANSAFKYLSERSEVNGDKIGVIGYSQGGLIAIEAASSNSGFVSMVTWAAPVGGSPLPMLTDEMRQEALDNGTVVVNFDWRDPLNFSKEWVLEYEAIDAVTDIANYTGAYLAIGGPDDVLVPWENSRKLAFAAGSKDSNFTIIKDADHLFRVFEGDPMSVKLRDITVEQFVRTFAD